MAVDLSSVAVIVLSFGCSCYAFLYNLIHRMTCTFAVQRNFIHGDGHFGGEEGRVHNYFMSKSRQVVYN